MEIKRDVARAAFIRQSVGQDEYVHVFGEVDLDTDLALRSAILEAAKSAKRVVVDLTRCTYIGSQGLGVLADARQLTTLGVVAPARVKRLMDIVGLTSIVIDPPADFHRTTAAWDA